MHHIYLRVSTDHQDENSQREGINIWLADHGNPDAIVHVDQVSGATSWHMRKLATVARAARPGDTIIVSEVSRIGRSTVDVLQFFKHCIDHDLTVIVVKSGLVVDDSMQSKITTTILALAAEIEREFLIARTREGIERAKADGVKFGRPVGSFSASACEPKATEIQKLLLAKVPKATIARIIGVHRHTLDRYLARQQTAC